MMKKIEENKKKKNMGYSINFNGKEEPIVLLSDMMIGFSDGSITDCVTKDDLVPVSHTRFDFDTLFYIKIDDKKIKNLIYEKYTNGHTIQLQKTGPTLLLHLLKNNDWWDTLFYQRRNDGYSSWYYTPCTVQIVERYLTSTYAFIIRTIYHPEGFLLSLRQLCDEIYSLE